MSKFAVFDIDGTLIRWQLYHALVSRLAKEGALSKDAHEQLRAARRKWKERQTTNAFKDYERLAISIHEKSLTTIDQDLHDKLVHETIDEHKDQVYIFTRDLIKELKSKNYKLFAISGSHQELVEQIGKHYGFDDWLGSDYERSENGFTGNKLVRSEDKKAALMQLIRKHKLELKESVGVGDSASDAPMLEMVEKPIAFNPDQELLRIAKKSGWDVVVERKNVIYKLQENNGTYELSDTNI